MNTEEEIRRIMAARNRIREKLMELGLSESMDRMDGLADALEQMRNNGSVSVQVKEGDTYTIPKGYHSGGGTVSGVAGGGSYKLQKKSILPDKAAHSVTPDKGFYGLSDVTVRAIPPEYVETGDATALAGDLLTGKTAYAKGQKVTGTMADNGSVSVQVKEGDTYTIPKGYHSGGGTVSGVAGGGSYKLQKKSILPDKVAHSVTPDKGFYGLSDVTVRAIPPEYVETGDATALAGELLTGKIAYAKGQKVTGTMADNGDVSAVLDCKTTEYKVPSGHHNGNGVVKVVPEMKTATPTKSVQTVQASPGKVMSHVTVKAIPPEYVETGDATALAGELLTGKTAYAKGQKVTGTMADNGDVSAVLDCKTTEYKVPAGHHNGNGVVSVVPEMRTATPTKSVQTVQASPGKVMSHVTVRAIPPEYVETKDATALAGELLTGKTAYAKGQKVTGTMADNGDVSASMDGLTVQSCVIPAGHTSGGTIRLTQDIENALGQI